MSTEIEQFNVREAASDAVGWFVVGDSVYAVCPTCKARQRVEPSSVDVASDENAPLFVVWIDCASCTAETELVLVDYEPPKVP